MADAEYTIVIIGGVAGGASAATRARRMREDANIILLEKDEHVSFANCGLPYYVGEEIGSRDALLVANPDLLRSRFRLDVRTFSEATAIDRRHKRVIVRKVDTGETSELPYDKVILAPGASPLLPPIPGSDANNVLTLRNVADSDRIKAFVDGKPRGRATVVGAGFIGLEMVEQLTHRGWEVTLVELQNQVLPLLDVEMAAPIEQELARYNVQLRLGTGIASIECNDSRQATAVTLNDGQVTETDLVIVGIGVRPNIALAEASGLEIGSGGGISVNEFMQTSDPDIYAVGDACEYIFGPTSQPMRVALAGPANRAGRIAGQHAATGSADAMQPVWGTSIVRVFGIAAGITGLSTNLAKRLQRPCKSVTVVGNHHAGYFPGAQPMTVKLLYDDAGCVLGAQVVGHEGVDKRLDVIATALHFGASVRKLSGLDLAYAPPFGSAKDPIHMAAFAACNELDGLAQFQTWDADLSDHQVVDVRGPHEAQQDPLAMVPHVINIPLDELRDRIDQLDPGQKTVVTCGIGLRGHVAARILASYGIQSENLSGGTTVRNRAAKSLSDN